MWSTVGLGVVDADAVQGSMQRPRLPAVFCLAFVVSACKEEEPPPEPEQLEPGDACDPSVAAPAPDEAEEPQDESEEPACAPGLSCEPTVDGEYVCGSAVEIRGRVLDALTNDPIEGALVAALDETGAPVTDVVPTDACGDYILPVSVRRNGDGSLAERLKWTLYVAAEDYQPFPTSVRPALPVDTDEAVAEPVEPEEGAGDTGGSEDEETFDQLVIQTPATTVALLPLDEADQGGATVMGAIASASAAGTLVVAEGSAGTRAPYGIADASGNYTVFNVPTGDVNMRGYRIGLELEAASISATDGAVETADLPVVAESMDEMATVSGSLNIVNAPGGSATSVVLVPVSLFDEVLERGPVPFGLRDPGPPEVPDVTSEFNIEGVPTGNYKVLVAFENDSLVRDPDPGIAGTAIQEVAVPMGEVVAVMESFKVTESLEIVGPGRDLPEQVDPMPTLVWADDSSEDRYELVVRDALGNLVWEDLNVPGVSGSDTVEVVYGGPALVEGMYYQFRVTSFKETPSTAPISRTEDLRGVFFTGEAPPLEECTVDEGDTGGGTGGTGG